MTSLVMFISLVRFMVTRQAANAKGALGFHGYPGHGFMIPSVRVGMGADTTWGPGFSFSLMGNGKRNGGGLALPV